MVFTLLVIERSHHRQTLGRLLARSPVVAILGARQVGKTTLARRFAKQRRGPSAFFDLERAAKEPAVARKRHGRRP